MKKIFLFAALMLTPVFCFAENYCEICGKDISLAKNSKRCAGCTVRESFGAFFEYARSKDKNYYQVLAERRVRRLGETVQWNFICVSKEYFPISLIEPSGEYPLDCRKVFQVRKTPDRIRIVLRDAVDTIIIKEDKTCVKHRGVYVLDNVPLCLPGGAEMRLAVGRNSVDTVIFALGAFDAEGRSRRSISGTLRAGQIYDLRDFR